MTLEQRGKLRFALSVPDPQVPLNIDLIIGRIEPLIDQFIADSKKKKPYTKPKFTIYGDVRGMTETSLARSRRSDHSKGSRKTA